MKDIISSLLHKAESELFHRKYPDLNSIPFSVINDIKSLKARPLQIYYLRNITDADDVEYLIDFISDVIDGDESAESWRKGVIVSTSFSLKDLLNKETTTLLESSIGMNFEHRTVPQKDRWLQNIQVGAPVIVIPEADYKYKTPRNCITYLWNENLFEPFNSMNKKIVLRRWVAQSIARFLDHFGQLNEKPDMSKLYEIVPQNDWSNDARMALKGLILELESGSVGNNVPGMTGSDEWYE